LSWLNPPRPGDFPVAHDSLRRDLEDFRRLLDAQSREKSQFHDLAPLRVDVGEPVQRLVECHQIDVWRVSERQGPIQVDPRLIAAPLQRLTGPRRVDQDAAHARAATAKKCPRFCHCTRLESTSVQPIARAGPVPSRPSDMIAAS